MIWSPCFLFSHYSKCIFLQCGTVGRSFNCLFFKCVVIPAAPSQSVRCGLCWEYIFSREEPQPGSHQEPWREMTLFQALWRRCWLTCDHLFLWEASTCPLAPSESQETVYSHSAAKGNVPVFWRNIFSGPKCQQICHLGSYVRALGIDSLVSSAVTPGENLERLFLWLFLMLTLEMMRRTLSDSYSVTVFLQEIIKSKCIVLLI